MFELPVDCWYASKMFWSSLLTRTMSRNFGGSPTHPVPGLLPAYKKLVDLMAAWVRRPHMGSHELLKENTLGTSREGTCPLAGKKCLPLVEFVKVPLQGITAVR